MQGKEYRSYSIEDYYKVITLKSKGLSQRKISKKVGVSSATVWHWTNTKRKPRIIYAKKKERKLPLLSKRITSELAYIFGVLIGDGYLENNKSSKRVVLNVTDKEFADNFATTLEKWSKMKPRRYERIVSYNHLLKDGHRIKGTSHMYIVRLGSKQVVNFLFSKGNFKTYTWNVPLDIMKSNDEKIICSFLKGLYDSDGYVIFSGRIRKVELEIYYTKGIEDLKKLLERIKIKSSIIQNKKKQKTKGTSILRISDRKSIEIFAKKINFTIFRKRKILKQMLKSYKRYVYKKQEIEKMITSYLKSGPKTAYEISKFVKRKPRTVYYHLKNLNRKRKIKLIKNWRKVKANASNLWSLYRF